MSTSKLGAHIIGGCSIPLANGAKRPTVVKLANVSATYVQEVRAAVGPDALIIVRWVAGGNYPLDDPARRAREWMDRYLPEMRAMADCFPIAFEGYNEVPDEQASAYCIFEEERLDRMYAVGLRSVVLNCSVGCPDFPVWATYQPVLDALGPGDLVGVHEYWADGADLDDAGHWHAGRFSRVPQLAGKPLAITECGRDFIKDLADQGKFGGKPGWQQTCSAAEFLGELRRYGALLELYPNVVGATVFSMGNDSRWSRFDPSQIWPAVVAEYSAAPTPAPQPPQEEHHMNIDGRCMTIAQFREHVRGLDLHSVRTVVAHETWKPTLEQWQEKGGAYWLWSMKAVYEGRGWTAGPHVYAAPDGIWLFTPLTQDGVGVTGHNANARHVEIVGNYEQALPTGATLSNAVEAIAILTDRAAPASLQYHHQLEPSATCPGAALIDKWPWFLDLVDKAQGLREPEPEEPNMDTIESTIRAAAWKQAGLERHADWAFPAYALAHNLGMPMGPETDEVIGGEMYRYQRYTGAIVYARVGDWAHVAHMAY